ncbi:MAG: DUF6551 family protein [Arthrobacter sp.]
MARKEVIINTAKVVTLEKPSRLVELHAKEFSIDLKVQRQLNEARADAMSEDFQPHALGLITASKRADGHIYVLDGGHRTSAARKANYEGLIACRLFENLTLQEEAALFLTLNSSRSVQAIDRFKVRITEGEPVAVGINKVLKAYGLHVDWANNESLGVISAIGALESVYAGAGVREPGQYPELVDKVIRTLSKAYGDKADRSTYSKIMLEGLGIFIATFGSRIDYDRLVYVLQGTTPRQIVVQTRALKDAKVHRGTLGTNAAVVLHRLYNNRWKAKLPEFHAVEPKNASYHKDRLEVDPNQYVIEDAMEKEKVEEKEKVDA